MRRSLLAMVVALGLVQTAGMVFLASSTSPCALRLFEQLSWIASPTDDDSAFADSSDCPLMLDVGEGEAALDVSVDVSVIDVEAVDVVDAVEAIEAAAGVLGTVGAVELPTPPTFAELNEIGLADELTAIAPPAEPRVEAESPR